MADGTLPVLTKVCTRCKAEKPLTPEFFYRDNGNPHGFQYACKACKYQPTTYPRRPHKGCCSKCLQEKPPTLEFFSPKKRSRGDLCSVCKACDAKRAAERRAEPSYQAPIRTAYLARWRASRPELMRKHYRDSQNRRRQDGGYRASSAMSCSIYTALKRRKSGSSWEKLVGFTRHDLVIHLERQFTGRMSWDNYGSVWHIDHIRPVSSFSFSTSTDLGFLDCWALSNLRPLPKRENLIKQARRTHLI